MVNRKKLLRSLVITVLLTTAGLSIAQEKKPNTPLIKLALLHLSLQYANLDANHKLLDQAIRLAQQQGAQWIVTPELALTGYRFDLKIGTDWIKPGPDTYVRQLQSLADELNIVLFLSHLEKSEQNGNRYNTLFVIDRNGDIIGKHRKINTIPISEDWSTPGVTTDPINIDGHRVGLLICADAWPSDHAASLERKGASLLISSASWAPGEYGPGDTWEKRSNETKIPLFVANKTGIERNIDQSDAMSVVSSMGQRIVSHSSTDSTLLLIDWNMNAKKVLKQRVVDIPNIIK